MKALPRLDELPDEMDMASRTSQTALRISPAGGVKHAVLTVLTGLSAGQVFTLSREKTLIGRSHDCQLRLFDPGISRRHCQVTGAASGTFAVEDLDSTNGMYVDGKPVQRAVLRGGERVQVGSDVVLRFGYTDETEEALAKRLYESSTRDPLTRAFTRKYFDERLEAEMAYGRRHRSPLGLIIFDVDHFKVINDTHGHPAGDEVLRTIANRMIHMVRTEDVFARYGGEEFVVLARGIKPRGMLQFAERIRKGVGRTQIPYQARTLEVTVSAGVANLGELDDRAGPDKLIALADTRVYQAKMGGRDRVCG
jgi:two-component system cell cycle response regulator